MAKIIFTKHTITQKGTNQNHKRKREDLWWETQKPQQYNTKTHQPKVAIFKNIKIHQSKIMLQERIKNLERERQRSHLFSKENMRECSIFFNFKR